MGDVYVIAGPTASGKTELAVALAARLGGEVVSADSMQVYKGMDIGTAKPTEDEKKGIPHHLIDVCFPNEPFNAALYKSLAKKAVEDILSRGKVPIITGGTGFYINALIYDTDFLEFVPNKEKFCNEGLASGQPLDMESESAFVCDDYEKELARLRELFCVEAMERGAAFLHGKLGAADPEYANTIHENNIRRVSNALAFFHLTSKRFSVHNNEQKQKKLSWGTRFFILDFPRDVLYERINKRTEKMFDSGLVAEAEGLVRNGYGGELAPMNGIGYKEAVLHLKGLLDYREAVNQTAKATRNYAKRQETWFRNQSPASKRLYSENKSSMELVEEILTFSTT